MPSDRVGVSLRKMKILLPIAIFYAILAASDCLSQDTCLETDDMKLHFVCPIDYAEVGGFQMRVTPLKEIMIECANLHSFNRTQFPNVTLAHINLLYFKNCPLPQNFKKILDVFATKDAVEIKFEDGNLQNHTINKSHFRGLTHLENLVLRKNQFEELDKDIFGNTPNLVNLDLKQNFLGKLHPRIFEKTPLLEWLELDDNHLDYLPENLFLCLGELEYLGLRNNRLRSLNDSTFDGLVNLKSLDLGENRIQNVGENAFVELKNLVNISLKMNQLNAVPFKLFLSNTKLQTVILSDNANFSLFDYFFANMSKLQEVDVSNCGLENIPEHIFENSTELKILNFQRNRLQKISPNLLKHLVYLEELDLASNHLKNVEKVFASLRNLKRLFLQRNRIETISERTFFELIRLEELNLQGNKIVNINNRAFFNNHRLRIINLSRNQYSGQDVIFEHTVSLEEVDLSYNSITKLEDVITLNNKFVLEILDLSHNLIENISLATLIAASETEIFLNDNRITAVTFEDLQFLDPYYPSIINLQNNPISCDCQNFDLVKYFHGEGLENVHQKFFIRKGVTCGSPENLQAEPLEDVPLSSLTCPLDRDFLCPPKCLCHWRPFDETIVINCANLNLKEFPKIETKHSTLEVNLGNNTITSGTMVGYENVTRLFLSRNKLTTISWVPPKLKVLKLDHNRLTHLSNKVLQTLNTSLLTEITLNDNPWTCDCGSQNLTTFVRQHSRILDFRHLFCANSTIRLFDLHEHELCQDFILLYITIMTSVLLVLAVSTTFYYRYRQEIKIWLFSKNLCLFWVSEEDLDDDKIYDAFISYSHRDEDFIRVLVSELESGANSYKLCLHYRDWVPGELINVQIVKSIATSKRTVVVLSKNFVESVWGKAEFQQAHAEAMAEGRARVILILYGDLDLEKLDENLKMYLKTNTYLKWGDTYFWNKLKYALPHRGNLKV